MEIVLVRHGEPEWVRNGLAVGDPPLTERGRLQSELLADRLVDEHFDEILVSPLIRARQTAAPLLERLGRPEVIAPWLAEIRDPGWAGSPAEKAEQAYAEMRLQEPDERWHGLDGGESVRDFVGRIHLGVEMFLAERGVTRHEHDLPVWTVERPGRRILLVAHAGTNSVSIGHLLGLAPTPWEWDRFVLGHTSVSRVESMSIGPVHSFSLVRLADVEHLPLNDRSR
jgi:broad specificity phosphatase PhoE